MPHRNEKAKLFSEPGAARCIGLELLTRNASALRGRIIEAKGSVAAIRAEILRTAERRWARTPAGKNVVVQLFGMPVVVNFGDQPMRAKREVKLLGRDKNWEAIVSRIWRSAFDSKVLDIRLVPAMTHLNAIFGIAPCAVHEQVFRGASVFEGRQPESVPMCTNGELHEFAGGPRAIVYLTLAYVASPSLEHAPAAGTRPCEPLAEEYLSAWFAVETGVPSVKILPPKRFYDALEDAHRAQLRHFVGWCKSKNYPHSLNVSSSPNKGQHVTITGCYQPADGKRPMEVGWMYDGSWRGPIDLTTVQQAEAAPPSHYQ